MLLGCFFLFYQCAYAFQSSILSLSQGKLLYRPDQNGDVISDFSYAGYNYGDPIPNVPAVIRINPISGDATSVDYFY